MVSNMVMLMENVALPAAGTTGRRKSSCWWKSKRTGVKQEQVNRKLLPLRRFGHACLEKMDSVEVSTFSVVLPLPFRVLLLLGLGAFLWASNLHVLRLLGIDAAHVLQTPKASVSASPTAFSRPPSLHPPIYSLLVAYSAWVCAGLAVYHVFTRADVDALDQYKFIPIIVYAGVLAAAILPFSKTLRSQRSILRE